MTVKVTVQMGKRYINVDSIAYEKLKTQIHTTGLQNVAKAVGQKVCLADHFLSDVVGDIEMLIGGDNYHKFVTGLGKSAKLTL